MNKTIQKLEDQIQTEEKVMDVHKRNGKYAEAEESRLKIEQLQRDLLSRELWEMGQRHKKEQDELGKANTDEKASFNAFWNKRAADVEAEGRRGEEEMGARHRQEQADERKQLEVHFSPKLKESSELLNLRKMEEHMVKQKNFAEAHRVQAQVNAMEKQENKQWMDKRHESIENALATLRAKQATELANLHQRTRTLLDELATDRKIEENRLATKHHNLERDLKSQQDKERLAHKGEFRSKGGSPSKSKGSSKE